ncbi:hypothetical protein DPMN_077826 [Dreissena polymorpha]|uniref:Uncharacterized protein n=1 Tax=Dreissena polymorpha TaxID=45954 RepID=A0A9D3YQ08_DREPO|nr:hypothetical protein DPMN_077826 [Dreissena polymorpha]
MGAMLVVVEYSLFTRNPGKTIVYTPVVTITMRENAPLPQVEEITHKIIIQSGSRHELPGSRRNTSGLRLPASVDWPKNALHCPNDIRYNLDQPSSPKLYIDRSRRLSSAYRLRLPDWSLLRLSSAYSLRLPGRSFFCSWTQTSGVRTYVSFVGGRHSGQWGFERDTEGAPIPEAPLVLLSARCTAPIHCTPV